MNTQEFTQFVLSVEAHTPTEQIDEPAVKEVAQLVSGSLLYRLYEKLVISDYDMDEVTEHLEMLCEVENYFGFIYFVFMLTDATNEELPAQFAELAANRAAVPYLASAIMEDLLDFHGDYEA